LPKRKTLKPCKFSKPAGKLSLISAFSPSKNDQATEIFTSS